MATERVDYKDMFEVGRFYLVDPYCFDDGEPQPKYLVPVNIDDSGMGFVLLTSNNKFPKAKEVRYGKTTYSPDGPFSKPKPAFVLPARTAVNKKLKLPKDTFVYTTGLIYKGPLDVNRIISGANKIKDLGLLHSGLFGHLVDFYNKYRSLARQDTEVIYRQHGTKTGNDGRLHLSHYERRRLLETCLTAGDLDMLLKTGTVTVDHYSETVHSGFSSRTRRVEAHLTFVLKSDGAYVVDPASGRTELAILVLNRAGGLAAYGAVMRNIQKGSAEGSRKKAAEAARQKRPRIKRDR